MTSPSPTNHSWLTYPPPLRLLLLLLLLLPLPSYSLSALPAAVASSSASRPVIKVVAQKRDADPFFQFNKVFDQSNGAAGGYGGDSDPLIQYKTITITQTAFDQ
ncbi:hypothetical protein Pcinc_019632, partial [Petrolisthes cinctipes]